MLYTDPLSILKIVLLFFRLVLANMETACPDRASSCANRQQLLAIGNSAALVAVLQSPNEDPESRLALTSVRLHGICPAACTSAERGSLTGRSGALSSSESEPIAIHPAKHRLPAAFTGSEPGASPNCPRLSQAVLAGLLFASYASSFGLLELPQTSAHSTAKP